MKASQFSDEQIVHVLQEAERGRVVEIWVLGLGSAPLGHLEMGMLVAALGAPSAL